MDLEGGLEALNGKYRSRPMDSNKAAATAGPEFLRMYQVELNLEKILIRRCARDYLSSTLGSSIDFVVDCGNAENYSEDVWNPSEFRGVEFQADPKIP